MKSRQTNLLSTIERDDSSYTMWIIVIIFFITIVRGIIFYSGGTGTNVHLLYIPILLSIFVFGLKGGIVTAIFAGIAVGPYTPIVEATNTMQTVPSWLFRILIFCMITIIFSLLVKHNKKMNNILIKKTYINNQTGYYNSNKLKLDLKEMINESKNENISLIMFQYENLDSISKYINLETGKKSFSILLDMANEFFDMGDIYVVNKSKFIAILPNYNNQDTFFLANEFIRSTKTPFNIDKFPISLVVKGGIVNYPLNEIKINDIIMSMDKALDQCTKYHNDVEIFDNNLEEDQKMNYNDLVSLYYALQNDKLSLVYQPKLNIQNNQIIGVKALICWDDIEHNDISISEMNKRAEYAGFINQITKWVIKNVSEQLKIWNENGIYTNVSISISARDLNEGAIVNYTKNYLESYDINPECIELELAETSIISDEVKAMETLKELKDMGIKLSIDYNGTKFNTVKSIMEYAELFEFLKIDNLFVNKAIDTENSILVEYMLKAAHKLNLKVVAEGVNTKERANLLKKVGCDIIQGNYYSMPLSPYELEGYLASDRVS